MMQRIFIQMSVLWVLVLTALSGCGSQPEEKTGTDALTTELYLRQLNVGRQIEVELRSARNQARTVVKDARNFSGEQPARQQEEFLFSIGVVEAMFSKLAGLMDSCRQNLESIAGFEKRSGHMAHGDERHKSSGYLLGNGKLTPGETGTGMAALLDEQIKNTTDTLRKYSVNIRTDYVILSPAEVLAEKERGETWVYRLFNNRTAGEDLLGLELLRCQLLQLEMMFYKAMSTKLLMQRDVAVKPEK